MWCVIAQALPEILVALFTRSQRNDVRSCLADLAGYLHHPVNALLRGEPGDVGDARSLQIYGQRECFKQRPFAFPFSTKVVEVEMGGKLPVGLRIPNFVIDTVRYSDQAARTLSRKPLE